MPLACTRCNIHKKKCVQIPGSPCERCTRLGVQNECTEFIKKPRRPRQRLPLPTASMSVDDIFTMKVEPVYSPPSLVSTCLPPQLELFSLHFDNLLTPQADDYLLQHPDLMPTLYDLQLVWADFTLNGTNTPTRFSIDARLILETFSLQPPLLRLILCALAATVSVSEELQLNYYRRARKALIHAMTEPPSLQTVQGLFNVYIFMRYKGQPVLGRRFLVQSLEMIIEMRLDIDPDDSPWLYHLNLTPRQKEERRRAFWASYWSLRWENALCLDSCKVEIMSSRIKPPGVIRDPELVFDLGSLVELDCEIVSILSKIKKLYAHPPASPMDLLAVETHACLNSELHLVRKKFPPFCFLSAESPEIVTASDSDRILNQLLQVDPTERVEALNVTCYYLVAVSTCNRPRLFLTLSTSFEPSKINEKVRNTIATSIQVCFEAACRIFGLVAFFLNISDGAGKHLVPPGQHELYSPSYVTVYAVFEAMVVFYFMECRLNPCWKTSLNGSAKDSKKIVARERLHLMVQFAESVLVKEGDHSAMEPIVLCMAAMVREMEGDAAISDEEELVLAMRVVSIGSTDDKLNQPGVNEEPLSFLGLLGLEVGGKVTWHGRGEDAWRLWWKLL